VADHSQPPRPLRVGDRERERVVAVLQRAVADGRLTMAELDDRLALALQARTRADLQPLVEDLDRTAPRPGNQVSALAAELAAPGYSRADPLRLDGGSRRLGVWTVPPFLRVDQESRWLTLDFQVAVPESSDAGVIDVEMVGGAGWVLLVLPDGWAADVARLAVGWGSTSVKVPLEPAPDAPLLVVHGAVGAGRLRIRHPAPRDRRRTARYLRRQSRQRQLLR